MRLIEPVAVWKRTKDKLKAFALRAALRYELDKNRFDKSKPSHSRWMTIWPFRCGMLVGLSMQGIEKLIVEANFTGSTSSMTSHI